MAEISDVQITLDPDPDHAEVRAHAGFVVAGLCVRGVKIVQVPSGKIRVVFPNMPIYAPCDECGWHVPITHRHCHGCGARQPVRELPRDSKGIPHRYRSVAFPISAAVRAEYEAAILHAFVEALTATARSKAS